MQISYYCKSKNFILFSKQNVFNSIINCELNIYMSFWGEMYTNQLYIVHKKFIHFFFKEKCIKINCHGELTIYASFLSGKAYLNQLSLWINILCTPPLKQGAFKSIVIVNWQFMHPASQARHIYMNYYCELKIYALPPTGKVHSNQLSLWIKHLSLLPHRRGVFKSNIMLNW